MPAENFWTDASEEYQQIAEEFYRNIELTHPNTVTSKRLCPCLKYTTYCGWAATSITYYEHRGSAI